MRLFPVAVAVLLVSSACADVPTEPVGPAAIPDLAVVGKSTGIAGAGVTIFCGTFGCTLIQQIRLWARLDGDGSVEGQVNIGNPGPGSPAFIDDGKVAELRPPISEGDWWCMSGQFPSSQPGFNFLVYVRDIGDGVTSFDEFAAVGLRETCASRPTPIFGVSELDGGNFAGHVR